MLGEHLINLVKALTEREKSLKVCREQNPSKSWNRERILENCESSLVISWLGTRVSRVLRMNASKPNNFPYMSENDNK
jgi:hypothetical protein